MIETAATQVSILQRPACAGRLLFASMHTQAKSKRYNTRMPCIHLNGETREIASGTSVEMLLASAGYADRRVAIEINREIVPRSQQHERQLHEGDRVEIVHALGGG